ncbi:hypothetical protein ACFWAX_40320, partial [Streptomyces sp. NPDC059956]|uniref:hypothetical protein n=1 Tax=Streptomyces sp. NPDC059956 TaxID=3347015 RepID=UPI00366539F5
MPRGLLALAILAVSGGTTRPEPHPIAIPAPSDRQNHSARQQQHNDRHHEQRAGAVSPHRAKITN